MSCCKKNDVVEQDDIREPVEEIEPSAAPAIEYTTDEAEPTNSLIIVHGLGMSGKMLENGELGPGFKAEGYDSKSFLKAAGVKATRVILPSARLVSDPDFLKALKAEGLGDGTPKPSWFKQIKDFSDLEQAWKLTPEAMWSIGTVQTLIRKEIARGIKPERIFVLAHSQGGAVATRAALSFPDAPLGGLIMLSAFHAWPDLAEATHDHQKVLKVLNAHSPLDKIVPFSAMTSCAGYIIEAVGTENFTGLIEVTDNFQQLGYHCPFCPSMAEKVGEFLAAPDESI